MCRDFLLKALGINPVHVERIVTVAEELKIELRDPAEGRCPKCGRRSRDRKTVDHTELQASGILGVRIRVLLPRRTFYCRTGSCSQKTFVHAPDAELDGRGGLLPAVTDLIRKLVLSLHLNNQDAVRILKALFHVETTEANVRRVLDDKRVRVPSHYAPKHLGIDERYPKGGRRRGKARRKKAGQLVLVDLDRGVLVASVRGIDARAAKRLFRVAQRRADLSHVETVTRDLCDDWDKVIFAALSQRVAITVDDFHLVRAVMRVIYGRAYVGERQRLRHDGKTAAARELFLNRHRFLKLRRRLLEDDKRNHTKKARKLAAVLRKYPHLRRLYYLKERFLALLDRNLSAADFQQELIHLIETAQRLKLSRLAKLLVRHSPFICAARQQPRPHYHPEQCHAIYRHIERRRKSFRTDRARARHERAILAQALREERAA